jgi:chorismate mutase
VEHVDIVEIGPDNMQNFVLLSAAGASGLPVILHRGPSATIDEWLMAAEYILAAGNDDVVLCERGSRGFDPRTTETLDISAVPVVQRLSHLPVIVDPDPSAGDPDLLAPLALAARSVGADGLILPVHHDPQSARAGNGNHLDPDAFMELMERLGIPSLRDEIDRVDRELIKMLDRRLRSSVEIARIKAGKGLAIRSPQREAELLAEVRADAESLSMDPDYAQELMEVVLRHSRAAQRRALEEDRAG